MSTLIHNSEKHRELNNSVKCITCKNIRKNIENAISAKTSINAAWSGILVVNNVGVTFSQRQLTFSQVTITQE